MIQNKYTYKLARNIQVGDLLLKSSVKTEHDEFHPKIETSFTGVVPVLVDSIKCMGKSIVFTDKISERFVIAKPNDRVRILKGGQA